MCSAQKFALFVICIAGFRISLFGQQLGTFETFKGADPASCTAPAPSNSFVV